MYLTWLMGWKWCPGMIEVSGINKTFILGDSKVHALDNINLRIEQGEYLSVMGPSGSGKSTLLNMLGLLDRPDEGIYLLNEVDTRSLDENERARLRREQIGFVFQSYHLIARLTARENMGDEMADVLFVLICLANQTGIDLTDALHQNLLKKTNRDADRHTNNQKLY